MGVGTGINARGWGKVTKSKTWRAKRCTCHYHHVYPIKVCVKTIQKSKPCFHKKKCYEVYDQNPRLGWIEDET